MATPRKVFPQSKPLGLLSDIHGNLAALDAALRALDAQGVTEYLVAGDLLWGGGEPLEVWKRLLDVRARCVRGASDTALARLHPNALTPATDAEREAAGRFAEVRKELGELIVAHLAKLPEMLRIPMVNGGEIVVVHGSPHDPLQDISDDLSDEEIAFLLADDPADVVVCGASHVPFQRKVGDVLVVNVGSVGDAPGGVVNASSGAIENVAHFSILHPRMDGVHVEQSYAVY